MSLETRELLFVVVHFILYFVVRMGIFPWNFGSLSPKKDSCNRVARYLTLINYKSGFFLVSVIHQTLTWTTGLFLTCVRDHFMREYTRWGWAHHTDSEREQHNISDSEKLSFFLVPLTGFEPRVTPLDLESDTVPFN